MKADFVVEWNDITFFHTFLKVFFGLIFYLCGNIAGYCTFLFQPSVSEGPSLDGSVPHGATGQTHSFFLPVIIDKCRRGV